MQQKSRHRPSLTSIRGGKVTRSLILARGRKTSAKKSSVERGEKGAFSKRGQRDLRGGSVSRKNLLGSWARGKVVLRTL